jgi:trehalose synthase
VLQKVTVGHWSLNAYDGIAPEAIMQELREHTHALKGARILNVNATSYGGGVSELLRSSVPLLRDLGLTVDWKVIGGDEAFFHATKTLHNALQARHTR